MPLYEYYCGSCGGIFEELRSLREASEPSPCPLCDRESPRIMPTSFTAFSMREGLARQLPDRGTYWHLGKEVKQMNTGGVPAFEHPELYKPAPKKVPSAGDVADIQELEHLKQSHAQMLEDSGVRPSVDNHGKPNLSPEQGASGHLGRDEVYETEKAREGKRT